jgi:two-component system phosphate regulon sensor histidine kinase PhoR
MARRGLVWKLFPVHVALVLACTALAGAYVLGVVRDFHVARTQLGLLELARLVARELERRPLAPSETEALMEGWRASSSARLTIIARDGVVLADSLADPASMESHAARPEVRRALAQGEALSERGSTTTGEEMLYAAVRGGPGVVRTAVSSRDVETSLQSVRRALFAGGLALVLASIVLWILHARWLTTPLLEIRRGAERLASGDLSRRIPVPDTDEAAGVAESLNRMAAQLEERLATIERQAGEQAAVLSSMTEGVLAADLRGVVVSANQAAARLLGGDAARMTGRRLHEVARHAELLRLASHVLETGEDASGEIVLEPQPPGEDERVVTVHASVLREGGARRGAVIVLDDVTRLRRLESVRQEFVANVSHELKTPVTSIQGFIETLRDGAVRDPARADRFLEIVARQAERLSSIIEDLLTLSRLEREGKRPDIPVRDGDVHDVLRSAVQACQAKASDRGLAVELVAPSERVLARMNPPLMEQAVVNLVDNAIEHSAAGEPVEVAARRAGDSVVIEVRDRGCGIDREHLPRLFERFYRVDRARSRKAGGTGLGLAIVKHIAQAHGGTVSVESEPGKGSTFRITLPAPT